MYKVSFYNIVISEERNSKIIYNSISKAYIQIPNKMNLTDYTKEINKNEHVLNENDYLLINNGFIIEKDVDEITYLKMLYNKYFFDSKSLSIIMIPTFACNFNCPYCFEAPSRNEFKKADYFKTLKKFAYKNFKFYKNINLSMFGGEPLLLFDETIDFLQYTEYLSKKYAFSYYSSITTNGSLITEDVLSKLLKYNCKTLQITIDGCRRTHDLTRKFNDGSPSFDKLIQIINKIIPNYIGKDKIKFILRINMNNNTKDEIFETLNLINNNVRNDTYLVLRPIFKTSTYLKNNENNFTELKELFKISSKMGFKIMKNNYFYRSCEACGDENSFYLTPDLRIWKCVNTLKLKNASIGFITDDGEIKINEKNLISWYNAADVFSDEKCKNCKLLPDCFGGCILYNVANGKRKCSPIELVSLPYLYE